MSFFSDTLGNFTRVSIFNIKNYTVTEDLDFKLSGFWMFVVRPHYIHQEIGTPLLDLFFKENNSYVIAGYLTHRNKYTSIITIF